jgi:SNF family Na+-dependent transporter
VLFAGWKMGKMEFMEEITSNGLHKMNRVYLKFVFFCVKYLAPLIIAVILVRGLL